MLTIGLTGGIGSGKTAASTYFEELGICIVDADVVARQIVEPGQAALAAIIQHFGRSILLADDTLDRAKLREKIFNNPTDKTWLESLLHPLIREEITRQLQAAKSPYVILVSPLLFETNQHTLVDRTLLIDVPEQVQRERAAQRDGNSVQQIQKIIDSQLPRKQKLARADDVIVNDKGLAELKENISIMHEKYLQHVNN